MFTSFVWHSDWGKKKMKAANSSLDEGGNYSVTLTILTERVSAAHSSLVEGRNHTVASDVDRWVRTAHRSLVDGMNHKTDSTMVIGKEKTPHCGFAKIENHTVTSTLMTFRSYQFFFYFYLLNAFLKCLSCLCKVSFMSAQWQHTLQQESSTAH